MTTAIDRLLAPNACDVQVTVDLLGSSIGLALLLAAMRGRWIQFEKESGWRRGALLLCALPSALAMF